MVTVTNDVGARAMAVQTDLVKRWLRRPVTDDGTASERWMAEKAQGDRPHLSAPRDRQTASSMERTGR